MLKKIFSCAAFVCLLCACSGTPKEREVTVSSVDITGFIKSYVKVVDGTYKFTNDGDKASISVKVELIDKPDIEYHAAGTIKLNVLDEAGNVFDAGAFGFSINTSTELAKIRDLLTCSVGDTKMVSFTWNYFGVNEEIGREIFTKAVSFEIIDESFKAGAEYSDNVESSSTTKVASDSKKWDEILDEYEKYVESYAKLIKKASSGDVSAMTESAKMLEHAQNLDEKFKDAKDDMSASQLKRYMEITTKIATAAMP